MSAAGVRMGPAGRTVPVARRARVPPNHAGRDAWREPEPASAFPLARPTAAALSLETPPRADLWRSPFFLADRQPTEGQKKHQTGTQRARGNPSQKKDTTAASVPTSRLHVAHAGAGLPCVLPGIRSLAQLRQYGPLQPRPAGGVQLAVDREQLRLFVGQRDGRRAPKGTVGGGRPRPDRAASPTGLRAGQA